MGRILNVSQLAFYYADVIETLHVQDKKPAHDAAIACHSAEAMALVFVGGPGGMRHCLDFHPAEPEWPRSEKPHTCFGSAPLILDLSTNDFQPVHFSRPSAGRNGLDSRRGVFHGQS